MIKKIKKDFPPHQNIFEVFDKEGNEFKGI
jgi:hypothetical protein